MPPPGKRIGPAGEPDRNENAAVVGDPISITRATDRSPYRRRTAPARRRFSVAEVNRNRRLARLHDDLLREMFPPPEPAAPSTFMLGPEALRAECNRLHASGWGIDEVLQVLDTSVLRNSNSELLG